MIFHKQTKFLIFFIMILASGKVLVANDWEYWSHFEARGTINDRLDYRVSPEFRFKDNFTDHYYSHLEFMLNWRVNSWCTLSPSYRHIQSLPGIDWITEQRPQLDLTLKWKMISMVGSDRNRMESRIRGKNTAYRYRNKLTFNLPKLRVMSTQPFFANEFFYDFEAREINKNRVYAGLDLTLLKSVKCSLQYILESSLKSDTWNNTNVLGTTLKYTF